MNHKMRKTATGVVVYDQNGRESWGAGRGYISKCVGVELEELTSEHLLQFIKDQGNFDSGDTISLHEDSI